MYEWDWADRLTKATSNGVVVLQNWYDAYGRRIAKSEVVNGATKKWLYLYDGWNIIGVMNESGQLLESYTRGVGLAGDIGTLVAVTHHAGSAVTPGTYYAHGNHRGDVVLTRNGTTTTGTYNYSTFGSLKSQTETDVSRFKYSSKERETTCGFSYYGARFYSPAWQRWPNRDPLGEPGFEVLRKGWASPLAGDANLYLFVRDNPNGFIDSDGLNVIAIPIGGIGTGAGLGVGGAIGIGLGAGVGLGLALDYYTPVGSIGTAIANRVCPKKTYKTETCRKIADGVDPATGRRFCRFRCDYTEEVLTREGDGCNRNAIYRVVPE